MSAMSAMSTSTSTSTSNGLESVASMSASRNPSKTAAPTPDRDGIFLIPTTPIIYDIAPPKPKNPQNESSSPSSTSSFEDITYHISSQDMSARIAFNRPEVLHAFRPQTIREIQTALQMATEDPRVGVIILTSNIDPDRYTPAFCAGGDQRVRHNGGGYQDGTETAPKLRVLDLQIQMRRCPKPIIAVVRGYAVGGGHILHMLCDLTLAGEDAVFGQSGPRMGSFDAGYGSTHMARLVGQKRAREMWFLAKYYSAQEALRMGLINAVFPNDQLEGRVAQWVRRIMMSSPTALACCKAAINADQDGAAGIAQMGGELTRLFYLSKESQEGRDAFLERRAPEFRSKL